MPNLGTATAFAHKGDFMSMGGTVETKLAKYWDTFEAPDLNTLFPREESRSTTILYEQEVEGAGVAPLVTPGRPDALLGNTVVNGMRVTPLFLRYSHTISSYELNDVRAIGTYNTQTSAAELRSKYVRLMSKEFARAKDFHKVLMMLGALSYTDPRTNTSVNVSANIPASNLLDVVASGSTSWHLPTSDPIRDVQYFAQKIYNRGRRRVKKMFMSSDLQLLLTNNNNVRKRTEDTFHPTRKVVDLDENGLVNRLGGIPIAVVDFNVRRPDAAGAGSPKLWPMNKVVLVCDNGEDEPIGKMVECVGESPTQEIGLWARSGPEETQPPAAPGQSMQMGWSGLPYIVHPEWMGIMTVGTLSDFTNIIDPSTGTLF